MTGKETMQLPADTRLVEELAEDDVVEMANLTTAQTGVPGTIFISTAMGGHGPRVKYFLQPGRSQPGFSVAIADNPRRGCQQPAAPRRPPGIAASHRLGGAQQGCAARFLVSRRHLDAT